MKDWDALYEECIHCQKCGLAETRTNVVFGEGDRDAEVMFIGEGPGEQEDRTGRPFVGRAGQLLDDMLAMIDLKREKVFIGNMVKCRPPQNRDPLNIEPVSYTHLDVYKRQLEDRVKGGLQPGPGLEGLFVIGVVAVRGEDEGAQKNPLLHLRAEALGAGSAVQLLQTCLLYTSRCV